MTGDYGEVNFMTVRIDDKKCIRCLGCVENCPTGALSYYRGHFMHSAYECNYERECEWNCLENAIQILDM